jgi:predicted metal-binding membrane protein
MSYCQTIKCLTFETGKRSLAGNDGREGNLETALRHLSGHRGMWLAFYAAVLSSWAVLFLMQAGSFTRGAAAPTFESLPVGGLLLSLCTVSADTAGLAAAFAMWALMSVAMMAPTVFPALRTYSHLTRTAGSGALPLAGLGGGYVAVWLGFSAAAAGLQVGLAGLDLLSPLGRATSPAVSGVLLVLAGAYQFTPLKEACVSRCRSPLAFFFSHWREGVSGGISLGLRLGAVCLGCCWALMLLAFVAGTMNLAFMGLATLLMTLEKLPEIGARVSAPLGVFLITAGAVVLALPLVAIMK